MRSSPDSRCSCAASYSFDVVISMNALRLGYCTSAIASQSFGVEVADQASGRPCPSTAPCRRAPRPSARPRRRTCCTPTAPSRGLNFNRLSITTGPSSGAFMSSMNCSLLGRMPLMRMFPSVSLRMTIDDDAPGARDAATLRGAQAVPRVPARDELERVERVGRSSVAGTSRSSWRRSMRSSAREIARDRRRVVDRQERGAAHRRDRFVEGGALRRPAPRSLRRGADERRVPLPLPLRDLGAQRLDVGEVVVHRPHRHAGAGRDLGNARPQRRRPRSTRAARR